MNLEKTSQNFYADKHLDEDFKTIVNQKIDFLKKKYDKNVLRKIYLDHLLIFFKVLEDYRPKSKIRKRKRNYLNYLDYHIEKNSISLTKKEVLSLKQSFLAPSNSLVESAGYRHQGTWIYFSVFGLLIDLVLLYTGVSKYYFYIPILFLYFLSLGIYKDKKAKKNNKLLRW